MLVYLYCYSASLPLQMDDIRLPMKSGTMEDISREDEPSSQPDGGSQSTADTPLDSMSSQGQRAIYAKEAQIQIDYSSLDEDYKEVSECRTNKTGLIN